MKPERRLTSIEQRANASAEEKNIIEGYSALFNSPTIIWDFEEIIAPGAFSRALKEKQNIRGLFNHDQNWVLASTFNDSLKLKEDDTGLWAELDVMRSVQTDYVVELVRQRLVQGQSFAFTIKRQEWQFFEHGSDQLDKRIITEIGTMYDVGPVTYPAYDETSINIKKNAKQLQKEARARWEEKRSRIFQVPATFAIEGRTSGEVFRELRSCVDEESETFECENERLKTDEAKNEEDKKDDNTAESVGGEAGEATSSETSETVPSENAGDGATVGDGKSGASEPAAQSVEQNSDALHAEIALKRKVHRVSAETRRYLKSGR